MQRPAYRRHPPRAARAARCGAAAAGGGEGGEGGAGGSAEAHSALLLQIIFGCMTICLLLVVTLVATEGVHSGSAVRFAALLAYPVSMVAANICEQ